MLAYGYGNTVLYVYAGSYAEQYAKDNSLKYEIVKDETECDKNGHTWDKGAVTKAASCEELSEMTYVCAAYREGLTDPEESLKEPVIVTQRLIGWDQQPGLTNGHAYRYRIVASLTGREDPSGDSALSYSKLMYRLKTVVIRRVKNTAPGRVTVRYDKTVSGDSYVLQYCEREGAGRRDDALRRQVRRAQVTQTLSPAELCDRHGGRGLSGQR